VNTGPSLARAAAEALAMVSTEPDVLEAEVFAGGSRSLLARLSYTSHIPSNGVEEPKSSESSGLGIHVVLRGPDRPATGYGCEPDLGPDGARRALARARRAAVVDPDFRSLPRPEATRRGLESHRDPDLAALRDEELVELGWRIVDAGLRTFLASSRLAALAGDEAGLRRLGLILGGDVTVSQASMAVASTAMPRPQTDESAAIVATATAMVEAHHAKGTGWSAGPRLADFTGEAGADAVRAAIEAIGGERVPAGEYTVVLGPQPVADLLSNLVVPACRADAFHASSTPFLGQLGRPVAASLLRVYDDGGQAGLAASRGITGEGLPTGRTDLIRDGLLVGCLTSWYEAQRLRHDPRLADKLGAGAPAAAAALVPRNGFRAAGPGEHAYAAPPRIAASNVVLEGAGAVDRDELIRSVGHGLYIGRIWYTYPVNGMAAGDFTCTVVGDSFVIRDGRRGAPIRANAIRINDSIGRLLRHVVGVARERRGTPVWAADEIIYTPEIAVTGVPVEAIDRWEEGS
jgi:predicted Zn-dependent protease